MTNSLIPKSYAKSPQPKRFTASVGGFVWLCFFLCGKQHGIFVLRWSLLQAGVQFEFWQFVQIMARIFSVLPV